MHCLVCGSEMRLDEVAGDQSVPVSGFERRTFRCPSCGDVEQRLAFNRKRDPSPAEPSPDIQSAAIQSASVDEQSADPAVAGEPVKESSGIYALLRRLLPFRRKSAAPSCSSATAPATEPLPTVETVETALLTAPTSPHSIESRVALTEADNDLDECEALLKRAIQTVRGPACSPEPAVETDLEGEAPLSTIEMDREPACASEVPGVLDFTSSKNKESAREPEPRPRKSAVVEIHYDPLKARYAARDTTTGLLVMRHEDRTRLKVMCERMGWQIVEQVG
jgi:hypothetical protein